MLAKELALPQCGRLPAATQLIHRCTRRALVQVPKAASAAHAVDAAPRGAGLPQPAVEQFPAPAPGRFSADRTSFSEEHRLRGYEVRPDQRATIVTISNLMQEVAGNHAVGMWGRTDMGFANLPSMKDLIFVMTRLQIRMNEYPKWGDVVNVETYFTAEGRLAARREWVISDAATGATLGTATSTWVMINTATRRISKLPDDMKNKFMRFAPTVDRCAIPAAETKRKLADIPSEPSALIMGPQQIARRSDMDMNGHINNVTYLAWALESVPADVYDNCALYEVEIDFKAECLQGERVESLCTPQEPDLPGVDRQYLHTLRRCGEGGASQELVRCRTSWKHAHSGNGNGAHGNGNGVHLS